MFVTLWGKPGSSPFVSSKYEGSTKKQADTILLFETVHAVPANTETGQQLSREPSHKNSLGYADFKAFNEHIQIDHSLANKSAFIDTHHPLNLHRPYDIDRPSTLALRELTRITGGYTEPSTGMWRPGSTRRVLTDTRIEYRRKHKNESSQYFWGDACEDRRGFGAYPREENHLLFTDICLALSHTREIAPFPNRTETDLLFHVAAEFLERIRTGGFLAQIKGNIYDEVPHLDLVSTLTYIDNVLQRLPKYRPLFEKIAAEQDLDWRLLAAITYQESHWNPKAVSPTGVRGLMMLTQKTAKELGVDNRIDPEQSVRGGTRYLNTIKSRLKPEVKGIDRLCMALASYNVGFGHLQDARAITKQLGADPNKWEDVKAHLPLLSKRKWYRKTRYGYARGYESVRFVENIRSYHKILVWLTSSEAKLMLVENEITEEGQSSL